MRSLWQLPGKYALGVVAGSQLDHSLTYLCATTEEGLRLKCKVQKECLQRKSALVLQL